MKSIQTQLCFWKVINGGGNSYSFGLADSIRQVAYWVTYQHSCNKK